VITKYVNMIIIFWSVAFRHADQHIKSMQINLQMLLWNVRADDDDVFSSRPLNFDTQSVQRGNCDLDFLSPINTATLHARCYKYRRYCTILITSGALYNSLKNTVT
jgi:hypothetical protein